MVNNCIIGKINEISAASDRYIKKRIKEEQMPILKSHIPLFYILPENGEAMLFNEIVDLWNISKSSLSDIITKYEAIGLIKKCSCKEDKRSFYISLLPEAVTIRCKLADIEKEFLDILLKEFNKEERALFDKIIDKALINSMKID